MAELSPIMQDSMKEEEDIVLYRYNAKIMEIYIIFGESFAQNFRGYHLKEIFNWLFIYFQNGILGFLNTIFQCSCHPAAELNEVFICSVTVWRVLVLPAKRTAWSTWNWKREELRWILQTPAIRGKEWIGIRLKWIEMDSVHWTLGLTLFQQLHKMSPVCPHLLNKGQS